MPKYDYVCVSSTCTTLAVEELEHSIQDCDLAHPCSVCGTAMRRLISKAPEVFFLGPGFASNADVARPNVGRNPSNRNRYSK